MTDNKALVLAYIEKEHPGIFKILQTPAGLHTTAEKVKLKLFKTMHSKEDLAKKSKKYFEDKAKKVVEAADKAAASKTPLGAALDAALASQKISRLSFMPLKHQVEPKDINDLRLSFQPTKRQINLPPIRRASVFPDFSAFRSAHTMMTPMGGARRKKATSKTRRKKKSLKKKGGKSLLRKRRKVTRVSKKRKTRKVVKRKRMW